MRSAAFDSHEFVRGEDEDGGLVRAVDAVDDALLAVGEVCGQQDDLAVRRAPPIAAHVRHRGELAWRQLVCGVVEAVVGTPSEPFVRRLADGFREAQFVEQVAVGERVEVRLAEPVATERDPPSHLGRRPLKAPEGRDLKAA